MRTMAAINAEFASLRTCSEADSIETQKNEILARLNLNLELAKNLKRAVTDYKAAARKQSKSKMRQDQKDMEQQQQQAQQAQQGKSHGAKLKWARRAPRCRGRASNLQSALHRGHAHEGLRKCGRVPGCMPQGRS